MGLDMLLIQLKLDERAEHFQNIPYRAQPQKMYISMKVLEEISETKSTTELCFNMHIVFVVGSDRCVSLFCRVRF